MFSYFAYGLGIHSTLPLPEFLPTKIACDVLVRLGGHESLSSEVSGLETSGQQRYLKVTPEEAMERANREIQAILERTR